MGMDQLKKEILDNAQNQVNALLEKTKKEAKEIINNAETEAKKQADASKSETKKMIETMRSKELSSAKFDSRKSLYDKKQELINQVLVQVKEQLNNMPQKDRDKLTTKLFEKASNELDLHFVYGNSRDKTVLEQKNYIFEENNDITGGVIAETKDKKIVVDYSYEQILEELKSSFVQDIAKILF